jgi:peptidoglycan/LPS O-acetylase OafA/YrhL
MGGLVLDIERRYSFITKRFLNLRIANRILTHLAFAIFTFIFIIAASKWKTELHWWSIWLMAPALALFWVNIFFSELDITWPNWLIGLGNLSYASYLIHFPAQLLIVLILGSLGLSALVMISPLYFLLYMAAIMIISGLVFLFFEKPAQSAIRRWALKK